MESKEEASRKRSRDDGIALPREEEEEDDNGDMQQPLLKRGFCLPPWPDSMEDHLHLLEDLCSGEESAAAAREDLVSEMMKTLENVINDSNTATISAMASSAPPPCSFAIAVNDMTAMVDSVKSFAAGSPPLSWHFEAAPTSEERGDTSVEESMMAESAMEEGIVVKDSVAELLTESEKKGVAENESSSVEESTIDLKESAAATEEKGIAATKAVKESFDIAFLLEASDDELGIQPLTASHSCDSSSSIMSDSFPESDAFCEAMDRNREEAVVIGTEESISWLDGDGDGHPSAAVEEMGGSFLAEDPYMTLSQESENELALGRDWGGEIVEENEESEEENDENSWYLQEQQRLLLGLERDFCC